MGETPANQTSDREAHAVAEGASVPSVWARVRHAVPQVLTVSGLIGVGYYGHHTEWAIPGFNSPAAAAGRVMPPADSSILFAGQSNRRATERAHAPRRVAFDNPAAVFKSGVQLATAEVRPMTEEVAAQGVTSYDQKLSARLSARVAGTVWRVEKHWGDAIRKGDVLAVIESVEIGRIKAEFLQARIQSQHALQSLQLIRSAGSSLPERQIREAEFNARESQLRLMNAEQTLINLGLTVRRQELERISDVEVAEKFHFLGLPPALVKSLDGETTPSNLLPIFAPFDGVVVGRDLGLGEVVEPSESLFEVADVRTMWIMLDVRKEDAGRMTVGQPVRFRVDGLPQEIHSVVSWVSTEVDEQTRTLQVRAEVDNPLVPTQMPGAGEPRLLRANTFGTGRITIRENPRAVVVPNEALHTEGAHKIVFVKVSDTQFEARRVTCGLCTDEFTEVLDLPAGTVVAGRGSHALKSHLLLTRRDSQIF